MLAEQVAKGTPHFQMEGDRRGSYLGSHRWGRTRRTSAKADCFDTTILPIINIWHTIFHILNMPCFLGTPLKAFIYRTWTNACNFPYSVYLWSW